jgi:CubicO group peptidase (beta-lactamase class C family)
MPATKMDTTLIDRALEAGVADGRVVGVAAAIGNAEGVLHETGFGERAAGGGVPMTADTVGWIASMTKAITGAAAMQQVEAGRLTLDGPAGDVLPQLRDVQVLDGFDADGRPKLRPPARPVTLRQLLTHTAGFAYELWNASVVAYLEATGKPAITACELAALDVPLMFDPGDRWEYGINIDFAGLMVEAVTGQDLEQVFRERLFEPLGMTSTGFKLTADQRARLAGVHLRGEEGSLSPIEFEMPQEPEFLMGGGGLYSTVGDYLRFTRMILRGGELDGERVLRPETVAEMSRNNMGDCNVTTLKTVHPFTLDANFYPDMVQKWGLSFLINTEQTPEGRAPGSLAWAGLANSYFWIDPTNDVTGVFLSQQFPFADPGSMALFRDFERAVYAAR